MDEPGSKSKKGRGCAVQRGRGQAGEGQRRDVWKQPWQRASSRRPALRSAAYTRMKSDISIAFCPTPTSVITSAPMVTVVFRPVVAMPTLLANAAALKP